MDYNFVPANISCAHQIIKHYKLSTLYHIAHKSPFSTPFEPKIFLTVQIIACIGGQFSLPLANCGCAQPGAFVELDCSWMADPERQNEN